LECGDEDVLIDGEGGRIDMGVGLKIGQVGFEYD